MVRQPIVKRWADGAMSVSAAEKIKHLFPDNQVEALALLEKYEGRDRYRVWMISLFWSKGSLSRLEQCLNTARVDYRDILQGWSDENLQRWMNDPGP